MDAYQLFSFFHPNSGRQRTIPYGPPTDPRQNGGLGRTAVRGVAPGRTSRRHVVAGWVAAGFRVFGSRYVFTQLVLNSKNLL